MNRAEEERVNGNVRVQQLQTKLLQSEQKIEALEQVIHSFLFDQQFRSFFPKEFLGYKNYTTSLLNKEKHLNERLQLLLNGRTN